MTVRKWSRKTERLMRKAGWHEGRDVDELFHSWRAKLEGPGRFQLFERAESALREFGGLIVEQSGPGHDFARTGFVLDPTIAALDADRFSWFEPSAGTRLFPLGEAYKGNVYLAIGEDGRVFFLMDELDLVAGSIEEAINCLLEGRLPEAPDRPTDGPRHV